MYARPCITFNVYTLCVQCKYIDIYLPAVCSLLWVALLSFHMWAEQIYTTTVSFQLGNLAWQKVLATIKEIEDETLTFTSSIFLYFALDPYSESAKCILYLSINMWVCVPLFTCDINCTKGVFRLSWFTNGTSQRHYIWDETTSSAHVELDNFYFLDFDIPQSARQKTEKKGSIFSCSQYERTSTQNFQISNRSTIDTSQKKTHFRNFRQ